MTCIAPREETETALQLVRDAHRDDCTWFAAIRPEGDSGPPPENHLLSGTTMVSKAAIAPLIAVVDDDESLRRSVARLLQASGFRSKTYDSAESLLADPHRSRFDCLIVDVQLNGMSGIGLREQLSSAGVKTPVILMTAREGREEQDPAYGSPGAAVLRKSDPGEKLLAMLRETLKGFRSEELNA